MHFYVDYKVKYFENSRSYKDQKPYIQNYAGVFRLQ